MRGATVRRALQAKASDHGATAIEYGAILLIAASIAGLLVLLIPNPLGHGVKVAVCKLFGGTNCDQPPFDYKPSQAGCITHSNSDKVGYSITVFSVKVGQNFQLVKTKTADGKVTLMVVPVDYKLGADAELGAGLKIGKNGGLGFDLGAKVEGTVNLKYGDAWKFDSEALAAEFLDDLKWDLGRKEAEKTSPGLWLFDKATGWKPRTPDSQIQQAELSAELALRGALGVGKFTESTNPDTNATEKKVKDGGTGAEIEGKVGDSVIVTKDNTQPGKPGYPLTSYTFQVKGSYKLGAKAFGYGPGGERTYLGQTKVTRDKDGRLVSITWVTTQEENVSEGFKNPGDQNGSGKGTGKKVTTTTTTVAFDDTNRVVGEQWIHDNAFLMPLQTVRNAADENGSFRNVDPGPNASPFDRLVYDQGKVSRNTYAGNVDEFKIAGKVGAEVKFGFDVGYEGEDQNLVGSQYLGAPQNGARTFQEWPECKPN
ncbi:MAG TPA: hypothetical protein VGP70_23535 [Actinomadura sp.]|jgi:Flp pilus assembly pilin Flp|nr:hypothetical protein [Actinomadura sp.]